MADAARIAGGDPNFPSGLDIHPLASSNSDADARFDSIAQHDAIRSYGIAGRIWEASHAMLAYLDPSSSCPLLEIDFDPPPPALTTPSSSSLHAHRQVGDYADAETDPPPIAAVELGSGNGFVAARVADWLRPDLDLLFATDLPDVCPLLETNLRACPAVRVRPLAWGSSEHAQAVLQSLRADPPSASRTRRRVLTHVLCSDLIYFPALLAPLLRSLLHLTSPPPVKAVESDSSEPWTPPSVIISYKIRSLPKETPFWNAFGLWFTYVPVLTRRRAARSAAAGDPEGEDEEELAWSRFSPGEDSDEMFVFVAHRRPESLGWRIPDLDRALLSGFGAAGTDTAKSDDQFEQLLLMGMAV